MNFWQHLGRYLYFQSIEDIKKYHQLRNSNPKVAESFASSRATLRQWAISFGYGEVEYFRDPCYKSIFNSSNN